MTKIKYVEANGIEHELHVENGQSVMQGAVENMLDGILAECAVAQPAIAMWMMHGWKNSIHLTNSKRN